MKNELKASLSKTKTLLILTVLCTLTALVSCVAGEIVLPVIIGLLSCIYLFDSDKNKYFSIVISGVLLAINVFSVIMGFYVSFISLSAIVVSYLISNAFAKGHNKAETAYLATVICAVLSLAGSVFLAMRVSGSYTFEASLNYYSRIFEELKQMTIDGMAELSSIYASQGIPLPEMDVSVVFEILRMSLISYIFISSFVSVGLGMKIFGAFTGKLASEKYHILKWRFMPSRSYAYVYVIISIIWVFISTLDNAFAVSVMNLYNIFSIIFLYVGFVSLYNGFKLKMNPITALFLLSLGTLMLSSLGVQILSIIGVVTVLRNSVISNVQTPPSNQE